jgi:hypothetical protein
MDAQTFTQVIIMFFAIRRTDVDNTYFSMFGFHGGKIVPQWVNYNDVDANTYAVSLYPTRVAADVAVMDIFKINHVPLAVVCLAELSALYFAVQNVDGDLYAGRGQTLNQELWNSGTLDYQKVALFNHEEIADVVDGPDDMSDKFIVTFAQLTPSYEELVPDTDDGIFDEDEEEDDDFDDFDEDDAPSEVYPHGHLYNNDGVCIKCGYDAVETSHQRKLGYTVNEPACRN